MAPSLQNRQGAMLLMTVLVVGAVALVVALLTSLRGISELDQGYAESRSHAALTLADGCAEDALERFSSDHSLTGSTLSTSGGSCVFTITNDNGDKVLEATATVERWSRAVRVRFQLLGMSRISVLDWQFLP